VRPWVRNYTIRRTRLDVNEVDIEFALHADGPASRWASHARPGDPAGIWDMGISYLPPAHAEWHLLVGEESAVPAILSILEHAPSSLAAEVFLEVPSSADIRTDVTAPPGARIHWLPRRDGPGLPGALAPGHGEGGRTPAGPLLHVGGRRVQAPDRPAPPPGQRPWHRQVRHSLLRLLAERPLQPRLTPWPPLIVGRY